MVIQREVLGAKRVELQSHPIILPTTTWAILDTGDRQKLTNTALKYAIISWNGDALGTVTPAGNYRAAFAQYQTRVQNDLNLQVEDPLDFGPKV